MNLATQSHTITEDFGDLLIKQGLLDQTALDRAKRALTKSGERLDLVLTRLGLVTEEDLTQAFAKFLTLERVNLRALPLEPVLPDRLKPAFLRTNKLLPLAFEDGQLTIATADPLNLDAIRSIAYFLEAKIVRQVIGPADFERAFEAIYELETSSEQGADPFDSQSDDALDHDVERLRDIASEAPTIRLVNELIADAVEQRASDIHIEPMEASVLVRFRIDGVLVVTRTLQPSTRAAITSRIKIMSKLDIAERRLPQDGRFKIAVRGNEIDLRVSTTPTLFGESVVLRILDRGQVDLDFDRLGFSARPLEEFRAHLRRPNGIVLVTGPTGSGKTTTLYTCLHELASTAQKIFTVEDPIEYHLAGMNQMQVKPSIGLDFARALRSILRQDPDIIMIGEIRDLETVQIAIQAALTGHLVFSTLHTNSAVASVTRLLDMGVEDYLLASTLNCILAQRLVRKLCENCARLAPNERGIINRLLEASGDVHINGRGHTLREAVGCEKCRGTGFSGRTTIVELLQLDSSMGQHITSHTPQAELEQIAVSTGMQTLSSNGMEKVLAGITTLDEVLRVTHTG